MSRGEGKAWVSPLPPYLLQGTHNWEPRCPLCPNSLSRMGPGRRRERGSPSLCPRELWQLRAGAVAPLQQRAQSRPLTRHGVSWQSPNLPGIAAAGAPARPSPERANALRQPRLRGFVAVTTGKCCAGWLWVPTAWSPRGREGCAGQVGSMAAACVPASARHHGDCRKPLGMGTASRGGGLPGEADRQGFCGFFGITGDRTWPPPGCLSRQFAAGAARAACRRRKTLQSLTSSGPQDSDEALQPLPVVLSPGSRYQEESQ